MIRKKKNYRRPMKAFEAGRIKEENELRKKYALKNKTEIWKTLARVNYFRGRAKTLAKQPAEEQKVFLNKLKAIGLQVNSLSDVLDLKVENLLDRRLSTIVVKKKIASTPKQARQMVAHKRILIKGRAVSAPSYLVHVLDEDKIVLKIKQKKPKPTKEPPADIPQESAKEQKEEVE